MLSTGDPRVDESTDDWVIGSDEVGYGCLAGPLTVCAAMTHRTWSAPGVGDSKKLTEVQRERAFEKWSPKVLHQLVWVTPEQIDHYGVWQALIQAHKVAILRLLEKAQGSTLVVVDGFKDGDPGIGIPNVVYLPKADTLVPAVSIASIIAKVSRDRYMVEQDRVYPGYDLASCKGYGTPRHQAGLDRLGPCAIHRKSYTPVAKAVGS